MPETRPLLIGLDPLAALQALTVTRLEFYEEAEFVCNTAGKTGEQVVQEIIAMLPHSDVLTMRVLRRLSDTYILAMATMSSSIGEV